MIIRLVLLVRDMEVFGLWRLVLAAVAGVLHFQGICSSEAAPQYTFMQEATKAPPVAYYDYIIIGGGTAGCLLAATLSQNFSVLLLESGGSPYGSQNITNLATFTNTITDTCPTSPAQSFISEDGVVNMRARVLGGGTCVLGEGNCLNGGFYTHAYPEFMQKAGLDLDLDLDLNRSYVWVEKVMVFEPQLRLWQSTVRDGLLEVGVLPDNGYTFDHIYGTKVGWTIFDKDHHRHTAFDLLQYANPSGLTVLLHANVHKILPETEGKSRPAANGVIFKDAEGNKRTAYLTKEKGKGSPAGLLAPNYTFMQEATKAPPVSYYDYIIIGGGTAGCPLAATLSQNFSVLLLERGDSPYGNPNITYLANFTNTITDTSPTSPAQRFVSEDRVVNTRARVLGGGTCLNAGFYSHADPEFVQKAGLDLDLVNRSYEWVEKVVVFEPQVRQWHSAVRDGLLEVGVLPYNGYTFEHIYGTKVGGTIFDMDNHRHTAADLLQFANPRALTVLLHATVHRILFKTKGQSKPAAHGVIFKDGAGNEHRAYLSNEKGKGSMGEIIVSAGALGSPQLLILSGIGPAQHLKSLGIKVLLDKPMVGQGMADNPMNIIVVPSPSPVEIAPVQEVGITKLGTYIESNSAIDFVRFFRLNETSKEAKRLKKAGMIVEKTIGPVSTGYLKLRNTNPDDNPMVTFNYFKAPEDLQRCVNGMKIIEGVVNSKAFSNFRYQNDTVEVLLNMAQSLVSKIQPERCNASTFKSWEQYCNDTVVTIWHYHGGCQVGRVVDQQYRVLGVDSLRVIDGSTFIDSPGTNPQATLMMLGRYMGIKIRNERLGRYDLD